MPYSYLSHIADLGLAVRAPSFEGVFSEALKGMSGYLLDVFQWQGKVKREVVLRSPDRTALLVDFLNEVLTLSHIHNELFQNVVFHSLNETALKAEIIGDKVSKFDHDIKAVTYHEAEVKNKDDQWTVTLIFDI